MKPKQKFFDLAKKISKKSPHKSHPMACVITKRNKVVSIGYNQYKTHPKSKHPYQSIHAELHAMLGCTLDELKDCQVYVYRETKNGMPAMARPCKYCQETLKLAGITEVFYSITNNRGWEYEVLK